jgi:hypothetical protein
LFLEICFNFFERISLSRDFNLKVWMNEWESKQ